MQVCKVRLSMGLHRVTMLHVVLHGNLAIMHGYVRNMWHSAAGGTLDALGVFDGHGGKGAGQYAAKHMMAAVLSNLKEGFGKDGSQGTTSN